MKIEVGKTYVDSDGDKIKIVAYEPSMNTHRPYLGIRLADEGMHWFNESGSNIGNYQLLSEHTEPRELWIDLARRVVYLTREDATVDDCECPTLYREVRS